MSSRGRDKLKHLVSSLSTVSKTLAGFACRMTVFRTKASFNWPATLLWPLAVLDALLPRLRLVANQLKSALASQVAIFIWMVEGFFMGGNVLGKLFKVMSFGESHGLAIGCVIDGCPVGLELAEADIQLDLDRRKPGNSRHVTQRKEPDSVEILSGVFEGKTTGTPIALLIRNQDARSQDYSKIANIFRPGHADYTYMHKYGVRDYRGGGRASARETAVRVAAGAVARKWLKEKFGIVVRGYMSQIGDIPIPFVSWEHVSENIFFAPNLGVVPQLEAYLDDIRSQRDSIGARIEVMATNVPPGWGEPVYDRIDADIAHAMMSINAVKGVEIGDGFDSIAQRGSYHNDELSPEGFLSNHSGGVLGGISSGQDIRVSLALKPTPSIPQDRRSIDKSGAAVMMMTTGRHDPCVGIRATPIAEAMLALVLMDHALRQRAQNPVVMSGVPRIAGLAPGVERSIPQPKE